MQANSEDERIRELEDNIMESDRNVESIKQHLVEYLEGTTSEQRIHSVLNTVFEERIKEDVEYLFRTREFPFYSNHRDFANMVLYTNDSYMDKKLFLYCLGTNTYRFGPSRIINSDKVKDLNDMVDPFIQGIPTYQNLEQEIMKWQFGGGTTQTGEGEAFLFLFGNYIYPSDKADIRIGNSDIEVKGCNGRLRGKQGTTAPINGFRVLYDELSSKLPSISEDPKDWNFKNRLGTINLFLNRIDNPSFVKEAFRKAFLQMYTDHSKSVPVLDKWLDRLITYKGTLPDNACEVLTAMQLDYYQRIEGFDSILFVNSRNMKYQYVRGPEDFLNKADNYTITALTWGSNSEIDSVNRLVLKG